jgi:hypothetical protein
MKTVFQKLKGVSKLASKDDYHVCPRSRHNLAVFAKNRIPPVTSGRPTDILIIHKTNGNKQSKT